MKTARLRLDTGGRRAIVDITEEVTAFVRGEADGLLNVSVPHATAGLVMMELGSGSEQDLWDRLDFLLPRDHRYVHRHGSPGGAAHTRDHGPVEVTGPAQQHWRLPDQLRGGISGREPGHGLEGVFGAAPRRAAAAGGQSQKTNRSR